MGLQTLQERAAAQPDERTSDGRYFVRDVARLSADKDFQERFSADPELNRLMSDPTEEWERNIEDLQCMGMTCRIAGVDIPPVALGHVRLLSMIGNEFVKAKQNWRGDFDYQLSQLAEALFVLRFGPRVVVSFAEYYRWRKVIATWAQDAKARPDLAAVVLDAERKAAEGLKAWDAMVTRWACENMRLEGGETVEDVVVKLDAWLAAALSGFNLFPAVKAPVPAKPDGAPASFFGMRSLRLRLSRALVRLARRLLPARCGGGSR